MSFRKMRFNGGPFGIVLRVVSVLRHREFATGRPGKTAVCDLNSSSIIRSMFNVELSALSGHVRPCLRHFSPHLNYANPRNSDAQCRSLSYKKMK